MEDLKLVPTDDLIKEMDCRFDSWVFIGVKKGYKGKENRIENSYTGGISQCIGLCDLLREQLLKYYFEEDEPDEEI